MSTRHRSIGGAVVVLSTIAAAVYFGYWHFTSDSSSTQHKNSLHRSNAVRYSRAPRRWRRGFAAPQPGQDPTETALRHLNEREQAGHGYEVLFLPPSAGQASNPQHLLILPSTLTTIYNILRPYLDEGYEARDLQLNVQAQFLINFFHQEYPQGYILTPDLDRLKDELLPDIDEGLLETVVSQWDSGAYPEAMFPQHDTSAAGHEAGSQPTHVRARELAEVIDDPSSSNRSRRSHRQSPGSTEADGQNVLDLLYRIGEEQAQRSGFHHRGVECNSCGCLPIRGVRYHCANCWDYDLCEACEAQQIHNRSHVFYKIRIPVPTRGQIKQVLPKWYPGNPNACSDSIPSLLRDRLLAETNLDRQELDALYEQYKCMAGRPFPRDPHRIGMTIDRRSFDMYLITTTEDRPPLQNLIYDRIFAFYDKDADGVISFPEFATGMAALAEDTTRISRLRRLFAAFDLDYDGYVDRKDFLRMMKAHYALTKEISAEMIYGQEEVVLNDEEVMEAIRGTNPISAAFGGNMFAGHRSRAGAEKDPDELGDLQPRSNVETLQEESDMLYDPAKAIGNVAISKDPRRRSYRPRVVDDNDGHDGDDQIINVPDEDAVMSNRARFDVMDLSSDPSLQVFGWPHAIIPGRDDVFQALNTTASFEDIADPVQRSKVYFAQSQRFKREAQQHETNLRNAAVSARWNRRKFYIDVEEGLKKPLDYCESESLEGDENAEQERAKEPVKSKASSRRPSLRSRSSSKVRFDDSALDTDYETKSDISSRSIPVNERWGGYELGAPDKDIGLDIMYQAVEQGFNDLLDELFKDKEDAAVDALHSRPFRRRYAKELDELALQQKQADEGISRADEAATIIKDESSSTLQDCTPSEKHDTLASSTDQDVDLSLPQNMPNEPGMLEAVAELKKCREKTFRTWLGHRNIDEEAESRGGYGKLNFDELRKKLVGSISKENRDRLESSGPVDIWEERASLGKFSFLSSWLEMATL